MNFYEHHLGDYAEATAHLTFVEDAAYARLIRKYYSSERPIPADLGAAQRLIGARKKEEKLAVNAVLKEFFSLKDDGWHNERCDEELARYHAKLPEAQARRAADAERQQRARDRRKSLFDQLRTLGVVPDFDASTSQLEALLSRHSSQGGHADVTRDASRTVTRDNTASQSPVPSPQSPVPNSEGARPPLNGGAPNGKTLQGGRVYTPAELKRLKPEIAPGQPRFQTKASADAE